MNDKPETNADMQPAVAVVHSVQEAARLPVGTVITWTTSDPRGRHVRHAAVVDRSPATGPYIRHTAEGKYWEYEFDLIAFPALALTWPADYGEHDADSVPS